MMSEAAAGLLVTCAAIAAVSLLGIFFILVDIRDDLRKKP
jgi:hypothetical protein